MDCDLSGKPKMTFHSEAWVYPNEQTDEVRYAHSLSVGLTRQEIKNAPAYDALLSLNRDDEEGIYRHYQRKGHWHDKNGPEAA
jgi:hypothetical protein